MEIIIIADDGACSSFITFPAHKRQNKEKTINGEKQLKHMFSVQCSDYLIDSKLPSSQPNDKNGTYIITHFKLYDLARSRRIAYINSPKRDETKKSHESIVISFVIIINTTPNSITTFPLNCKWAPFFLHLYRVSSFTHFIYLFAGIPLHIKITYPSKKQSLKFNTWLVFVIAVGFKQSKQKIKMKTKTKTSDRKLRKSQCFR